MEPIRGTTYGTEDLPVYQSMNFGNSFLELIVPPSQVFFHDGVK